jgi:arsenate reductase
MAGEKVEVFSAGTEPTEINPMVIKILAEDRIDISKNRTKNINEFLKHEFDIVITVCDRARESCPVFHNTKEMIHKSFPDPSTFQGTDEVILDEVRKVRDNIKDWMKTELIPKL